MSSNDTSRPAPPVSSVIISKKKQHQQQDKEETLVFEMNEHDVLLVRSKLHDTHDTKGKVVLRQLVTDVAAKYAASQRRADKQRMVMEILHTFTRQQGGRFLQCRSKDAVPTPPPPSQSHPWRLVTDQTTMVNVIKVALRDAMARKHQTGKRLATAKVKSTPTNNNNNNTHHQEGNSTVASSTVGKDSHAGHEEEDGSTVVDDHTSTGHVKVEPTSSMSPGVKALPEQVGSIRGQLAAKPSLDSAANNEARDLLVYLALVGQIPSSSQDNGNNGDALMARALMEQRQQPLPPPPQQPSVEDTLNQLILEQQLIEQQRRELLQRQFERRNRQQLEELIQLEQLRQHLGNHRAMLPPSTSPGFPPMGGSSSSLEDAHAELVMAQALEQARLAQQLSTSRLAPPPPADLAMAQALEQARLAQHLSNIPMRPPPPTNADLIMAQALEQARLAQQFNPTRLVAPQPPPPPPPMNNANAELIMAQALEQARIAELLQRFPQ